MDNRGKHRYFRLDHPNYGGLLASLRLINVTRPALPWTLRGLTYKAVNRIQGFPINREDIASHIKRFGDYIIDSETVLEPICPSLPI